VRCNLIIIVDKINADNMGLPINASMKTKEKVAALENYVQDLEVMNASSWWWMLWQ
jgi:hypothetical protein